MIFFGERNRNADLRGGDHGETNAAAPSNAATPHDATEAAEAPTPAIATPAVAGPAVPMRSRMTNILAAIGIVIAVELAIAGGYFAWQHWQESASASLEVSPAFNESFEAVQALALEHAADSKLIGVSTTQSLEEGESCDWTYFFLSRQKISQFTVTQNQDGLEMQSYGKASCTREVAESIPGADQIQIDADEAFALLAKHLSRSEQYLSCSVSLITFDAGAEDPWASSLKWAFTFNEVPENEEGQTVSNDSPEPFTYTVDAVTGEIQKTV